jgi:DNA-directed RNA polymerase I, II, and III subunit RPABC5
MAIPTLCYTCGNVISDKWEEFVKLLRIEGVAKDVEIAQKLGLHRYCCIRMLITHQPTDYYLLHLYGIDNVQGQIVDSSLDEGETEDVAEDFVEE